MFCIFRRQISFTSLRLLPKLACSTSIKPQRPAAKASPPALSAAPGSAAGPPAAATGQADWRTMSRVGSSSRIRSCGAAIRAIQPLHRPFAQQIGVLRHRGERRLEVKAVGGVIVAGHRYRLAAAAIELGQRAEHAERHLIVCHHYGADPRLQVEELESFLPAAGGAPVAKHRSRAGNIPDCATPRASWQRRRRAETELSGPASRPNSRCPSSHRWRTQAPQPSRWSKRTQQTSASGRHRETGRPYPDCLAPAARQWRSPAAD